MIACVCTAVLWEIIFIGWATPIFTKYFYSHSIIISETQWLCIEGQILNAVHQMSKECKTVISKKYTEILKISEKTNKWLYKYVILVTKNDSVSKINELIHEMFEVWARNISLYILLLIVIKQQISLLNFWISRTFYIIPIWKLVLLLFE